LLTYARSLVLVPILLFLLPNASAQVEHNLLECDNCLWTLDSDSIYKWEINWDKEFRPKGVFKQRLGSLAYGSIKHTADTLLNTLIFSSDSYSYWDGKTWKSFTLPPAIRSYDAGIGAHAEHLYLMSVYANYPLIYHYDGDQITLVDQSPASATADIAVDAKGRAWYFESKEYRKANSLVVLNKDGIEEGSYPINPPLNSRQFYGIAIVNDYIYLGLGPENEDYPNSILALTVEDGRVVIKKRIPYAFEGKSYLDLASSKPGVPDRNDKSVQITVYPNPSSDYIKIYSSLPMKMDLEIFDMQGQVLLKQKLAYGEEIDISHLATGTYGYRAWHSEGLKTGLLVKN